MMLQRRYTPFIPRRPLSYRWEASFSRSAKALSYDGLFHINNAMARLESSANE